MRSPLVFIEANTTGTGMLALERGSRLGLSQVFVTSRPERYRGLSDTDAEVLICDTNRPGDIADRLDHRDPAGITTTSEYYLPTVAELATRFAVPGNPPAAVRTCRDKAAVRAKLRAAHIPQPRFETARSSCDVDPAIRSVGLPCVVKPVDESGSFGVRLCSTYNQVREHVAELLAIRCNVRGQTAAGVTLIEEYVPGPEYSVELFGHDGELTGVGVTEKTVVGAPWFIETGHVFPAPLNPPEADAITKVARRAVTALDIGLGPTHTEIRLTPQGPVVIEVNARLAGGMIPELIRLATGVDLLEQQIRAASGRPVCVEPKSNGHAGIAFLLPPGEGRLVAVAGDAAARDIPGITRVTVTSQPGSTVHSARDAYQRLGHLIAAESSDEAVRRSLARAQAEIQILIDEGDTGP